MNKDNIFLQSKEILQQLYLGNPINTAKEDVKLNNAITTNNTNFTLQNINLGRTQELNNFLSCLGFKVPKEEEVLKVIIKDPSIDLALRAQEGVFFVKENQKNYLNDTDALICQNGNIALFSNDGRYLAVVNYIEY